MTENICNEIPIEKIYDFFEDSNFDWFKEVEKSIQNQEDLIFFYLTFINDMIIVRKRYKQTCKINV